MGFAVVTIVENYANLVEVYQRSCRDYAASPLFGVKLRAQWQWSTYAEFQSQVDVCRGGLWALGVRPSDRVALVSNNCPEWATVAYASYGLRAAIVPMYEAQSTEELEFILRDSGAKVVFGASSTVLERLLSLKPQLPELKHVLAFRLEGNDPHAYSDLLARGRAEPKSVEPVAPNDPAGFIYTSGTTGQPKGAILTHKNIVSNLNALRTMFQLGPSDRSLAFLPWAHVFGQTAELHMLLSAGCSMALNDEITNLVGNLAEVSPTILIAVPLIFNKIYDGVHKQITGKPKLIQRLFSAGMNAANRRAQGYDLSLRERTALYLADRMIFSKIRMKFGGKLRYAISGSAALSKEIAEFVDALGIAVYEGYGLTEASPVVSVNCPGARRIGSVGRPLSGVRVEIKKPLTDDPTHGEIIVYGDNVMKSYHNRDEETHAMVASDGALHTGDMGYLDKDGYLYITGRLKEQYKLENGKYVVPSLLEEKLKLSPYIINVMVYGNNKPYNVALIVIDQSAIRHWAAAAGRTLESSLVRDAAVIELIRSEVEAHSKDFRTYEKPRAFLLILEDFTVDNGLLTRSLKLRRRNVVARYQEALEQLYRQEVKG